MMRKTKSRLPSKGGTQKSKIKDKAKGIDPIRYANNNYELKFPALM